MSDIALDTYLIDTTDISPEMLQRTLRHFSGARTQIYVFCICDEDLSKFRKVINNINISSAARWDYITACFVQPQCKHEVIAAYAGWEFASANTRTRCTIADCGGDWNAFCSFWEHKGFMCRHFTIPSIETEQNTFLENRLSNEALKIYNANKDEMLMLYAEYLQNISAPSEALKNNLTARFGIIGDEIYHGMLDSKNTYG